MMVLPFWLHVDIVSIVFSVCVQMCVLICAFISATSSFMLLTSYESPKNTLLNIAFRRFSILCKDILKLTEKAR